MKITIGGLELRQFTAEDAEDLHRVRNDPSVRRYMSDPTPIPLEAHLAWVKTHLLEGRDLLLFMVRRNGEAIGFTLLRRVGGDTEIGVMFKEATRHPVLPAYATVATLYCAFCLRGVTRLISYVAPAHERALALNRGFGAWEVESDKPGMIKFRLSPEVCLANPTWKKMMERLGDRMQVTE